MFPNSINRRITQTQQRLQNGEFMSNIKISTKNLDLYYGENHALKNINMNIKAGAITAFIGPSGCGKSTFLKTLNHMNDLVDNVKITGEVKIDGDVNCKKIEKDMEAATVRVFSRRYFLKDH